jgi:hypothetical protein
MGGTHQEVQVLQCTGVYAYVHLCLLASGLNAYMHDWGGGGVLHTGGVAHADFSPEGWVTPGIQLPRELGHIAKSASNLIIRSNSKQQPK